MAAKDRCCHKSMILAEHNGGSAFSLAKLGAVFRIAAVIQMLIRQVRIWLSLSLSLLFLYFAHYPRNPIHQTRDAIGKPRAVNCFVQRVKGFDQAGHIYRPNPMAGS
jgi:hypothetical protein